MAKHKSRDICMVGFLILVFIWIAGTGCNPVEDNPLLRHAWVTFLGGSEYDAVLAVAVDSRGNILVAGISANGWGSPLNPHLGDGSSDVFLAKVTTQGRLVWHTFLGGTGEDNCVTLLVDQQDNIFLTGSSAANWGNPVVANSGQDAYVVKLDASGQILWNTFLGSTDQDSANDLALDGAGNLVLAGVSKASWGTPILAYAGARDGFIAKLDINGIVQWNTFFGSVSEDYCTAVTVDNQDKIFVGGQSQGSWGNPLIPTSGSDGFVAALDNNGNLVWNTFFTSTGFEEIWDIVCDQDNNLVMTVNDGHFQVVGSDVVPIYLCSVVKMDVTGQILWKSQLGSLQNDRGRTIIIDGENNIYTVGESAASWGDPVHPFNSSADAFAAKLNSDGQLIWNTFMGSDEDDFGNGIVVNAEGEIIVCGVSMRSWGTPLDPYTDKGDGFISKIQISQE